MKILPRFTLSMRVFMTYVCTNPDCLCNGESVMLERKLYPHPKIQAIANRFAPPRCPKCGQPFNDS